MEQDDSIFSNISKAIRGGRRETINKAEDRGLLTNVPSSSDNLNKQDKQQQFLDMQSQKLAYDIYSRSMYYVTDRITAYQDYRAMDTSPEVSAALDILSDEICSRGESGKILNIYSENSRIKTILKNLFYRNLNIDFNMPYWSRNLLKYGDFFMALEIDQKEGVYDVRALRPEDVTREEAWDGNASSSRFKIDSSNMYMVDWQMAHFRVLSDDTMLPYGKSILYPARKLWKQLQLSEDAMLTYRITRAPERRVFYIEVGNIDPADVPQYIEKVKATIKKAPSVNQRNGAVNLKYSPMPVWSESLIPLLDGRTITIKELAKEFEEGKENFVTSVRDNDHQIVPGKIVWCGKNYDAKLLTKIWLDDNTWVMTAPEHPFVLRDGTKVEAQLLKESDSLMPLYEEKNTLYNPNTGKYEIKEKLFNEDGIQQIENEICEYANHKVSRVEFIKQNEEVYCMTVVGLNGEEDRHNFATYSFDAEGNNSGSGVFVGNSLEEDFFLPQRNEKASRIETLPGACLALDTKINLLDGRQLELSKIINEFNFGKTLWTYSINPKTGEVVPGKISWAGITRVNTEVVKIILENGQEIICTPDHKFHNNNGILKEAKYLKNELLWKVNGNEEKKFLKVVDVIVLNQKTNTGTLTIDVNEEIHNFHNFALSVGVYTKNSNLDQIADIEYLQNKLFAALKVPKPYLNYAETIPGGSALAQSDLRFARTVVRLQGYIVAELRRIANIHLYLLGFEDDLDNFELTLTNPSTQQEMLKLETMKLRLDVFERMFKTEGFSPLSYTKTMQDIMGYSESEIKQILRQKKMEKKMFAEIEGANAEYRETGIFSDLDKKFRIPNFKPNTTHPKVDAEAGAGGDADFGGEFGGGTSFSAPEMGGLEGGLEAGVEGLPGEETAPETGVETPETPIAENNLLGKNDLMNYRTKKLLESLEKKFNKVEIKENENDDVQNDNNDNKQII